MKRRSAYTLVELTVVMSMGSTLLFVAVGLLHQAMTLASASQAQARQHRELDRLARQFRLDVHRAAECSVVPPLQLGLVMPDQSQVRYEVRDNRILRRQSIAGQSDSGDSFLLASGATANFELRGEPERAGLTVLARPHPAVDATRVDRQVVAVVGRLLAHETAAVTP
jgi:type II secretory pathway pseudopilin PulG